jgi:hypothetical protein
VKVGILMAGVAALMACASKRQQASVVPTALEGPALLVGRQEVRAIFPRAAGSGISWPAGRAASRWSTDQWRLMIPLDPHWLVAAHRLEVDSSLAVPARASTDAAVAAGHLVSCELDTHVIACGEPLKGSVEVVQGEVVFHVRDSNWRRTLRAKRPRSARLLFLRGAEEVLWEGVVDIEYQ